MAFIAADRVKETSTTTGTGTYTLAGAVTQYRAFSSVMANNDRCDYLVRDGFNSWELVRGVYSSGGNSLTRAKIVSSSNNGSAVNWGSGTRTIEMTGKRVANIQACLVYKTDSQTLPQNTHTAYSWNKVAYDPWGCYSTAQPTRLTVPDGWTYVRWSCRTRHQELTSSGPHFFRVLKNGTDLTTGGFRTNESHWGSNFPIYNWRGPIIEASSGDYFELVQWQDIQSLSLSGTAEPVPWFCLELIA